VTQASGIITLLTDFGIEDSYVAAMKGVILSAYPKAIIVDVTHAVRPYTILEGAYLLDAAWRSFPAGTVHLAVVDPGVGGQRPAIAFGAGEHYFVGPDNGIFSLLHEPVTQAVFLKTPPEASWTFHGRDVFAPAAARLAAGGRLKELGSPAREGPLRLPETSAANVGEGWQVLVLHCDRFGNLITNLPLRSLSRLRMVNGQPVRSVRTYEEAQPGELVALVGSSGRVEFAVREASAAGRLHTGPGETLLVN
jgi:S-adenosylmethionine hydrolase